MGQTHEQDVEEDEFDADSAAEEIKQPVTQPGDIWQLGPHRLICGDSTDTVVIAKLMDGKQARLIITDLPYNVNYEGGTDLKIKNDNMADSQFFEFLLNAYKAMFSAAEPGCPIDDNTVYAKFFLMDEKTVVVPYDDIIHLRRFYYKNDMYGETHNTALTPILQVITTIFGAFSAH